MTRSSYPAKRYASDHPESEQYCSQNEKFKHCTVHKFGRSLALYGAKHGRRHTAPIDTHEETHMDNKVVGLIGAIAGLASFDSAQAAPVSGANANQLAPARS